MFTLIILCWNKCSYLLPRGGWFGSKCKHHVLYTYVHVLYMCLRCVRDVAFIDLAMVYMYMYSTFDS